MLELEANLRLTPEERVLKHQRRLDWLAQARAIATSMDEVIREGKMEGAI